MRITLATYNIHSCIGMDGVYDPDRITRVLKELDADITALQEVDSREHKGLELLKYLAGEVGLLPIAGPTLLRETGHYGNAILTRYPVLEVRHIDLSLPDLEPRGAIDVDLDCKGNALQVIATHLGLRPAERRFQVKRLLNVCMTEHCALLGDLNEWFLWGRPLRWLKTLFGKTPHLRTFPAVLPILALDRIWVRPPHILVNLVVHKTPLARVASDHLPLKAVIELKPS